MNIPRFLNSIFLLIATFSITFAQKPHAAVGAEDVVLQWHRVLTTTVRTPSVQPETKDKKVLQEVASEL